jgi:hypothetical protein
MLAAAAAGVSAHWLHECERATGVCFSIRQPALA